MRQSYESEKMIQHCKKRIKRKTEQKKEKLKKTSFFEKIKLKANKTFRYIPISVIKVIYVSIVGHFDYPIFGIRQKTLTTITEQK